GSGSDLASLQCKAVREGDAYVVNGQKIWTSIAMWSKWMILLVRTETNVEVKHDGITCLLVEMDSPGIDVRPIKNMAGGAMFAEVFFNDLRVPVENRLGEEGQGWQVTISALAHERSGIAEFHGLMRNLDRLKELARTSMKNGKPAIEEPQIRRRLVRAETKIEAMRLNGMRFLTKQLKGEKLSSETSINKLHRAQLEIELGEISLEVQGSAAPLWQGAAPAAEDGHWQRFALSWPEVVIGGGTPNIQKNIIAERILGLPKDG
ncbi:MAG: acyl-CoA dehydrogenase family protein, partial [Myxococcota bacterium]